MVTVVMMGVLGGDGGSDGGNVGNAINGGCVCVGGNGNVDGGGGPNVPLQFSFGLGGRADSLLTTSTN